MRNKVNKNISDYEKYQLNIVYLKRYSTFWDQISRDFCTRDNNWNTTAEHYSDENVHMLKVGLPTIAYIHLGLVLIVTISHHMITVPYHLHSSHMLHTKNTLRNIENANKTGADDFYGLRTFNF